MLPSAVVDLTDFEDALIDQGIVRGGWNPVVSLSRETFENFVSIDRLHDVVTEALAGVTDLATTRVRLELVGGGSRVPVVSKFFCNIFKVEVAGRSMDGSAFAALGAALWAAGKRGWASPVPTSGPPSKKKLSALLTLQTQIEAAHATETTRLAKKNALEAYLFETNRLLEDPEFAKCATAQLRESIAATWAWFEDSTDSQVGISDGHEFEAKLHQLQTLVQDRAAGYFVRLAEQRQRSERELERGSAAAGNVPRENVRESRDAALSKEQALRLALKNKDEGNELFKHGTPIDAMNRYMRAINILAGKRGELAGAEQTQANQILLACNLNIAQCVIRMTGSSSGLAQDELVGLLKRAVACADSALAIDPKNAKASYRKAVCLSRLKEPEQAKKVVDAALAESPLDEDLRKLYESLVQTLGEQKSKAKQFFSRMFQ